MSMSDNINQIKDSWQDGYWPTPAIRGDRSCGAGVGQLAVIHQA